MRRIRGLGWERQVFTSWVVSSHHSSIWSWDQADEKQGAWATTTRNLAMGAQTSTARSRGDTCMGWMAS
eukprot:4218431-Alexandrium_andersonii.AAC.1